MPHDAEAPDRTATRAAATPLPADEPERLAALYRSRALDDRTPEVFEDLVQLAAQITGMPIASLNLLDEDEQVAKATHGLPREALALPRDQAACSWAILEDEPVQWSLQTDPRTRDTAAFRRFGLHAYAGAPVRDRDGRALGALCVMDTREHPLSDEQLEDLAALARQAAVLLEWRVARVGLQQRLAGLPRQERRSD